MVSYSFAIIFLFCIKDSPMICTVSVDLSSDSDDSDDESSVSTGGNSVSSSESFYGGVSIDDGPSDAFDVFKFWMPKIWEHYQPHMLSDIVCVAYLLSPDPLVMAHSSDKANIDPLDRLAMENLV